MSIVLTVVGLATLSLAGPQFLLLSILCLGFGIPIGAIAGGILYYRSHSI